MVLGKSMFYLLSTDYDSPIRNHLIPSLHRFRTNSTLGFSVFSRASSCLYGVSILCLGVT